MADDMAVWRGKRTLRRGVKRHGNHQHDRTRGVALQHGKRIPFPKHFSVMQADDDMRYNLHPAGSQRFQGALEIVDAAAQMVDLGDGVLCADDIHHGGIDAGVFHALCRIPVHQRGVQGDPEMGEDSLMRRRMG